MKERSSFEDGLPSVLPDATTRILSLLSRLTQVSTRLPTDGFYEPRMGRTGPGEPDGYGEVSQAVLLR